MCTKYSSIIKSDLAGLRKNQSFLTKSCRRHLTCDPLHQWSQDWKKPLTGCCLEQLTLRNTCVLSFFPRVITCCSRNNNNNNNNNKRQFVRRRNMSVDITRAPYRQSGNVVRDSSTETRLWVIGRYKKMGFQTLFKFVKCYLSSAQFWSTQFWSIVQWFGITVFPKLNAKAIQRRAIRIIYPVTVGMPHIFAQSYA